jgi:predicted MFS family arabinose efflux permease
MANNPAVKSYIYLKSEPGRVASNMTIVFGTYPLGLVVSPLAGGWLAETSGMRTVFLVAAVLYVVSATCGSLIRETPYHTADQPWSLGSLRQNRRFRRYVLFFLAGYLATYVGQALLNPYLDQAHGQGYGALGMYASLAALGAAVLTPLMGRATDLRGARAGVGGVLVCLLAGTALLITAAGPAGWGLAMLLCGSYDSLRFVATGFVSDSFQGLPLAWGYALFDAVMGIPMVAGAVLGGVLFRAGAELPFVLVIAISAVLLAGLWLAPPEGRRGGAAGPSSRPPA